VTALAALDAQTRRALRDSFFAAARLGELDGLRTIFSNYPELLDAKDDRDGATALILAAENGHLRPVKFLVENKADIFETDSADRTALYAAAQAGRALIAEYLVEEGLDPEDKGDVNLSPIGIAEAKGFSSIAEIMRSARVAYLEEEALKRADEAAAQAEKLDAIGASLQGGTAAKIAAPMTARFAPKP